MQYSQAVAVNSGRGTQWSAQDNSDATLVEAIAGGDKHALQVLYGRHHVKVYRFALRFVRDEASAEDLVSEVFIDVWRQAERFERRRSNEQLDDEVAEFIEDSSDNPEVSMQKQERGEILRSCLSELSPAHREIIDLVYYHERSIEEVSEIIGVPANTVKTRMFYARKRIGEMMAARGIERYAI